MTDAEGLREREEKIRLFVGQHENMLDGAVGPGGTLSTGRGHRRHSRRCSAGDTWGARRVGVSKGLRASHLHVRPLSLVAQLVRHALALVHQLALRTSSA